MDLIEKINLIIKQIAEDDMTRLRLEEQLLYILAKNTQQKMSLKCKAFARINKINDEQKKMLGNLVFKKVG